MEKRKREKTGLMFWGRISRVGRGGGDECARRVVLFVSKSTPSGHSLQVLDNSTRYSKNLWDLKTKLEIVFQIRMQL